MDEEKGIEEKGKKLEDIRKEAEEKACPVQRMLYYMREFISGPMCSRCFPCAFGTAEAEIRLDRIARSPETASDSDIQVLKRIGQNMIGGSFCKKGKDSGKFLIETISSSDEEVREHVSGKCSKKECLQLIQYVIKPELCIMCGKCTEICQDNAIVGEKREPYLSGYLPFEIRQKRCTRCGDCIKVCPTGAIECITAVSEELQEAMNK
jgi:NAD-dependent dihydropyrimidine dehydrogenase PreA subunit